MPSEVVELVFKIRSEGKALLEEVRRASTGVNDATRAGAAAAAGAAGVTRAYQDAVVKLKIELEGLRKSQHDAGESFTSGVVKANLLVDAVKQLGEALKSVSLDSGKYAARTEQINRTQDQLARVNEISGASVRKLTQQIAGLGITQQEAAQTVNKMIFAQLDLTKATEFARLAQNAAKIEGISSTEALERLTHGVTSYQIEVLRNLGINVQFERAFLNGARAMGKTTDQLTNQERATIALNEVLKAGERINGVYEVSLFTVAGQMQTLRRYTDDAKQAIGEEFLPIISRGTTVMQSGLKAVADYSAQFRVLTEEVTAAGIAIAAARLTPGGPVAKAVVGSVAGVAAFIGLEALNDPEAAIQERATEGFESIALKRRRLQDQAQKGLIESRKEYEAEIARLDRVELLAAEQVTEQLARFYLQRDRNIARLPGQKPSSVETVERFIPQETKLGPRTITRAEILDAVKQLNSPDTSPIDPKTLRFKPDAPIPKANSGASLVSKLREATQQAQGALDRAQAGLLTGEEKVASERAAALAKLASEFKPFGAAVQQGAEYRKIVGLINAEFDKLLEKERRSTQASQIRRDLLQQNTRAEVAAGSDAALASQRLRLLEATAGEDPARRNDLARGQFEAARAAAEAERRASEDRLQREYKAALDVAAISGDAEARKEAAARFLSEDAKTQAAFQRAKDEAAFQYALRILGINRQDREEARSAAENVERVRRAQSEADSTARRGAATRAAALIQAGTLPGGELRALNAQFAARVISAKEEARVAAERATADREAAKAALDVNKDRVAYERAIAEIRAREIGNARSLEESLLDARAAREVSLLEARKRQTEELRGSLSSLYDALTARGGGGFGEFLDGFKKQFQKTLFVNAGTELLRGAQSSLGSLIPGQQRSNGDLTALGRILRGTPLGVDPLRAAQDRQIKSVDRNSQILEELNATLQGGGLAAGVGAADAGGDLAGRLGGVTSTIDSIGRALGLPTVGVGGIIKNLTGAASSTRDAAKAASALASGVTDLSESIVPSSTGAAASQSFGKTLASNSASLALAGLGVYGGIRQGGVPGGLSAAGSALLGVSAVLPDPVTKGITAAVGTGLSLVGAFVPNKRKEREELINRVLRDNTYFEPTAINATSDLTGAFFDYDQNGRVRVDPTLRGVPLVERARYEASLLGGIGSDGLENVVTTPGRELSPFQPRGGPTTIVIQAMDPRSFAEFSQRNAPAIADAALSMIELGHPMRSAVSELAGRA